MKFHPVKNEKDYAEALAEIEKLWDAKPGTPEGDRLEIWVTLVEAYEVKRHPIPPPDPVEAIKFRMEQMGMSNSELARYLGGRNRVSEILSGKRGLTVKMMKRLHAGLKIPAESLLAG
jgi:HTH-type transcriptional regulator/antitoxin HigA